ncbi:FadR/GntR family transcriptional regulator [Arthrobacter sp. 7Tela_A1]|uniref:FadR/GntR family transcriptional regulator n=1 Tax=Arthrobacter sp. 7Tela_A1 TaxID=3093745 RepID=UPI003BB72373
MKTNTVPLEMGSKSSEVAAHVESEIRRRNLAPGDRICTKDELRESLGVARATVNEGVRILHDRGCVFLRPGPGGGLFVAPPDSAVQLGRFLLAVGLEADSVTDAIALRDFLETMVLQEAVVHRRAEDVADLRSKLSKIASSKSDPRLFVSGIWDLHVRIAEISPNLLLRSTYLGLMDFISRRVVEIFRTEGAADESYYEHRIRVHAELVDVIEAGELESVADAIRRHQPDSAGA